MTGIVALLLRMALQLVSVLFARSARKAEYERLIRESIMSWEKRTGNAAKLREDHRKADTDVEEKWKQKWGGGADNNPIYPPTPKAPVSGASVTITGPAEAQKGAIFFLDIANAPMTAELYRDRKWKLLTVGLRSQVGITLNSPADRVELSVKVGDEFVANHVMKII